MTTGSRSSRAGLEASLRKRLEKKPLLLMAHAVAGYPSLEANRAMLRAMDEVGVDLVELQLPFSEPIADGPTFVRANQAAIEAGVGTDTYFELLEWAAGTCRLPVLFMGYYNSAYRMGEDAFCRRLAAAGARGFIIADLPPEEGRTLEEQARAEGLDPILIMAPTSSGRRLEEIARHASGFIYCVARKGVTGKRTDMSHGVGEFLARVRRCTKLPLGLGFGLKTPDDVRKVLGQAEIAIVGTACLEAWERGGEKEYRRFLEELVAATGSSGSKMRLWKETMMARPWLEAFGVLFLALAGAYAGLASSRLKKPYWLLGYVIPMIPLAMVAVARWDERLSFIPPLSWFVAGRTRFVVLAASSAMVLMTPRSRLRNRRERMWVTVLMAVAIGYATTPFLAEGMVRNSLLRIQTRFSPEGVCIQSTGYTCGPAAAVTALRHLGVSAGEGELAMAAHTTPTGGTQADSLMDAIQEQCGGHGVTTRYRFFPNLSELETVLAGGAVVIAVVKHSFLVDHYIVVFQVTSDTVMVGDPLAGGKKLSREAFENIWRRSGIVLRRKGL